MEDEPNDAEITRPPIITDLVELCRLLNERGANYVVLGGMAINIHGFIALETSAICTGVDQSQSHWCEP